jgi:hypothetical protein
MSYLTHPVRRLRDDPVEGETVRLLVTAEDEDAVDELAERLGNLGTVEDRLRFGTVRVQVAQSDVAAVCDLGGVDRIETANTLELDPDGAGEDVSYEE